MKVNYQVPANKITHFRTLFFKFCSYEDCRLSVEVSFPAEDELLKRKNSEKEHQPYASKFKFKQRTRQEVLEYVNDKDKFASLMDDIKLLKRNQKLEHRQAASHVDFVQRNVDDAEIWSDERLA